MRPYLLLAMHDCVHATEVVESVCKCLCTDAIYVYIYTCERERVEKVDNLLRCDTLSRSDRVNFA